MEEVVTLKFSGVSGKLGGSSKLKLWLILNT